MDNLRPTLAEPVQLARWEPPTAPIRSQSSFPVTALSAPAALSPALPAAYPASAGCSTMRCVLRRRRCLKDALHSQAEQSRIGNRLCRRLVARTRAFVAPSE